MNSGRKQYGEIFINHVVWNNQIIEDTHYHFIKLKNKQNTMLCLRAYTSMGKYF